MQKEKVLVQEEFKVVAVSKNTNSFGLRSVIMIAKSGKAFEVLCNSMNAPEQGKFLTLNLTEEGELDSIKEIGLYEVPQKLSPPPKALLEEIFG
jgi:hypothetical protein